MNGYGIHSTLINLKIERYKFMFTSEFIKTLTEEQAEMLWNTHVENKHIIVHIGGHASILKAMTQSISTEQNAQLIRHIRMGLIEEYSQAAGMLDVHDALKKLKPGYSPEQVIVLYDKALIDVIYSPALASFKYIPKDENPLASYKSMIKYFGREKVNSILFTALNPVK